MRIFSKLKNFLSLKSTRERLFTLDPKGGLLFNRMDNKKTVDVKQSERDVLWACANRYWLLQASYPIKSVLKRFQDGVLSFKVESETELAEDFLDLINPLQNFGSFFADCVDSYFINSSIACFVDEDKNIFVVKNTEKIIEKDFCKNNGGAFFPKTLEVLTLKNNLDDNVFTLDSVDSKNGVLAYKNNSKCFLCIYLFQNNLKAVVDSFFVPVYANLLNEILINKHASDRSVDLLGRSGAKDLLVFSKKSNGNLIDTERIGESVNNSIELLQRAQDFVDSNQFGSLVLSTVDADINKIDLNNTNAIKDYQLACQWSANEIYKAFNVPMPLIENQAQTFSNYADARLQFLSETLLPFTNQILLAISSLVSSSRGIDIFLYTTSNSNVEIMQKTNNQTTEFIQNLLSSGIISREEARKQLVKTSILSEEDLFDEDEDELFDGNIYKENEL